MVLLFAGGGSQIVQTSNCTCGLILSIILCLTG